MKSNIYFIYTPSFKGHSCELLYGLEQNKDSMGHDKKKILQQHELPSECKDLNLTQLAMIYPYQGKQNEA